MQKQDDKDRIPSLIEIKDAYGDKFEYFKDHINPSGFVSLEVFNKSIEGLSKKQLSKSLNLSNCVALVIGDNHFVRPETLARFLRF